MSVPRLTAAAASLFVQARKELADAVQKDYPIGCRVSVTLGNARITGLVEGHGQEWSDPWFVYLVNEATGKRRRFDARDESAKAVVLK